MTPGVGTRALVSQVLFSGVSVLALGAVAKTANGPGLGYAVVAVVIQATANSLLRGSAVNALLVYRGSSASHPEDRRFTVRCYVAVGAVMAALCAAAGPLIGGGTVPWRFVAAVVLWQLAVLAADTVRAYDAFLGARWTLHAAVLVAATGAVAGVSAASWTGTRTVVSLAAVYGVVALGLGALVRSAATGGEPVDVRRRLSVAREGLWVSTGLTAALVYVASADPVLAAGWQVVNQAVASPLGYLATAVNTSVTRRLVANERRWRTTVHGWLGFLVVLSVGAGLLVRRAELAPLARAVVGPVWDSSQRLVLPCVAYMLYFQLVFVVAILLRLAGRARVDAVVLAMSLAGSLAFAVVGAHGSADLEVLWALPAAAAAVVTALAWRPLGRPAPGH